VIALARQPDEICLTVTDDGQGDSRQESTAALQSGQPGNGLRGLRERVAALGGRCEAGSVGKHGFRLTALVPLLPAGETRPALPQAEQARGAM
jgi:two-component system sensor histidine kinase DesK